jgi:hypothetical protein
LFPGRNEQWFALCNVMQHGGRKSGPRRPRLRAVDRSVRLRWYAGVCTLWQGWVADRLGEDESVSQGLWRWRGGLTWPPFLVDIVEGWTLNGPLPRSSGWSASTRRRIPGR